MIAAAAFVLGVLSFVAARSYQRPSEVAAVDEQGHSVPLAVGPHDEPPVRPAFPFPRIMSSGTTACRGIAKCAT
jgi:hypothetical protein